jgi:hypothetical protein
MPQIRMMQELGLFVWFRNAFKPESPGPNNTFEHPIRKQRDAMAARLEFSADTDERIYISCRAERD